MKNSHFKFSISDKDKTDLVVVSVTDIRTGYTVRTALPNSGKQTASIMAFAGARFSRSALSAEGLFQEIRQAGSNANEKLANIFRNYGHSSVADMAQLFAYIEQIPDHYSTIFFNESSVGGGQQRSTRYQDFGNSQPLGLDDLGIDKTVENYDTINQKLIDLQKYSLEKYKYYQDKLTSEYIRVYNIDETNKSETGALTARAFDSTRYFLPSGLMNKTSLAYITSAREWARLISVFKASNEYNLVCLAEQLEILFAPEDSIAEDLKYTPEAPDLIRYTEADTITNQNLYTLQQYLEEHLKVTQTLEFSNTITCHKLKADLLDMSLSAGTIILLQHILTIYPNASIQSTLQFIDNLNIEQTYSSPLRLTGQTYANKCVSIFWEAEPDIYNNKTTGTTSYLTSLFNASATLFANDNITVYLSGLYIWTTGPTPYSGGTTSATSASTSVILSNYRTYRGSSGFTGDLAHLLTFTKFGGGRAYINSLCTTSKYAVSGIYSTFSIPNLYSWSVNVVTHEQGHSFGSYHTHACYWNSPNNIYPDASNGTPIDGCAPICCGSYTEGCVGPLPTFSGGTIMSYCHLLTGTNTRCLPYQNANTVSCGTALYNPQPIIGVDFNLGFGPQPKQAIINT
ncbi:hypothetical protein EBU71_04630, partial [bacterium]|nr:hypothetical protein [Candidatus Elulimicrobium humile]